MLRIGRLKYGPGVAGIALAAGLAVTAHGATAPRVTPGQGLKMVTRTSTGIYTLGQLYHNGKAYTTLALFCNGTLREVHTRDLQKKYLQRRAGPAIRVGHADFTNLINDVGGTDRSVNINNLTGQARTRWTQACGGSSGSSGGSKPPTMPRKPGETCPSGYEPAVDSNRRMICRAIAHNDRGLREWLAGVRPALVDALERLIPISVAEARAGNILIFKYSLADTFSNITFEAHVGDPSLGGYDGFKFEGLGFSVTWLVPSGG